MSMLSCMRHAAVAARHVGKKWGILDALHLATKAGADALVIPCGTFDPGQAFDAVLLSVPVEEQRTDTYGLTCTGQALLTPWDSPQDKLEKLLHTGDDRNIVAVWVHGRRVGKRAAESDFVNVNPPCKAARAG